MTNQESPNIEHHQVVSHVEWLAARIALLAQEKEFTRQREELARQRRALPWEKVETQYIFDGTSGKETLTDLFGGHSQLVVYHFMFGPDDDEGLELDAEHRAIRTHRYPAVPLTTAGGYGTLVLAIEE
jgi:predicted dithiol-disulfide oxidoreductase (DUF899 family)